MPSSRGSSDPGIKPVPLKSPALAGGFFTTSTTGEGPTPFQTLLILAPERLFLKPNFHRPYLTESEVSLRERKASQIPRPTSYCSPALYSSPFRHQCHQLFPAPVFFLFFTLPPSFSSSYLSPSPSSSLLFYSSPPSLISCSKCSHAFWGSEGSGAFILLWFVFN